MIATTVSFLVIALVLFIAAEPIESIFDDMLDIEVGFWVKVACALCVIIAVILFFIMMIA